LELNIFLHFLEKFRAHFVLLIARNLIVLVIVRMFSFVGDTVLDPFLGTGTTSFAAAKWGRNSIGIAVDPHYLRMAEQRLARETAILFGTSRVEVHATDTAGKGSK